jgi:hypothetical protein
MIDKGFKGLLVVYVLLFIADIATTLSVGVLAPILETNPLYAVGGWWLIITLNLAVIAVLYYAYGKYGHIVRYVILLEMITIIALRILAVRNALSWMGREVTVEQAQAIATPAAKAAAFQALGVLSLIAIGVGFITFLIYYVDHKVSRKI